jgi:hypothetical protein
MARQTRSSVCSWLCANSAISIRASSPPSERNALSPSTTAATSRKRCLRRPKLAASSGSESARETVGKT